MIESAIQTALAADADLVDLLAEYNGAAAIFSSGAPEDAERPYITYHIDMNTTLGRAVHAFSITINVWDRSTSRAAAREIVERVEFVLDQARLSTDRYDTIRVNFESAGPVDHDEGGQEISNDPRNIQYTSVFGARAGRKKWMATQ